MATLSLLKAATDVLASSLGNARIGREGMKMDTTCHVERVFQSAVEKIEALVENLIGSQGPSKLIVACIIVHKYSCRLQILRCAFFVVLDQSQVAYKDMKSKGSDYLASALPCWYGCLLTSLKPATMLRVWGGQYRCGEMVQDFQKNALAQNIGLEGAQVLYVH